MALAATPRFEDISVGFKLPMLRKGPLTHVHLMRWSAAMENWHRIHYDQAFAVDHDKLPGILINGSLKQQFVMQSLADWAGPEGWAWKASFQFRAMSLAGETLSIWAAVVDTQRGPDYGLVRLELGITNGEGKESTPGSAIVALPYRDGKPVPYPFVPPAVAFDN